MPNVQCPMPNALEHLMLLRKAILTNMQKYIYLKTDGKISKQTLTNAAVVFGKSCKLDRHLEQE